MPRSPASPPSRPDRARRAARTLPAIALAAFVTLSGGACRGRVPDVGGFTPVLEADGTIVEMLREADSLAQRDPEAAATNLRERVLPRARDNWERAGSLVVQHPRAQTLRAELVRIAGDRVGTVEGYAAALHNRDPEALHVSVQRQVALDRAMLQLERDVDAARHAEPERGCAVAPRED